MTTVLETIETLLPALSRAEKALLLQWIVQDLGDAVPGVEGISGLSNALCNGLKKVERIFTLFNNICFLL